MSRAILGTTRAGSWTTMLFPRAVLLLMWVTTAASAQDGASVVMQPRPVRLKQPIARPLRITVELAAGSAAALVSGAAGYSIGCGVGTTAPNVPCGSLGQFGILFGGAVGLWAGVALSGYLLDGDGSLLWTLVAETIGLTTGWLAASVLAQRGYPTLGATTAIVLPIAGALLGYELTSHDSRFNARLRRAEVHTTPMIFVAERHPVVGIAGAF